MEIWPLNFEIPCHELKYSFKGKVQAVTKIIRNRKCFILATRNNVVNVDLLMDILFLATEKCFH